ncbi:hypothetical protein LTR86_003015 [Recurvomyces mirabilis]|nr:hypothetical protein LTR86_003015 [Recurvomyces mirabilis]
MRSISKTSASTSSPSQLDTTETSTLFKYTSGRWIYNEQRRLAERERVFNVIALQRLAAAAVSRKAEDIFHIDKLGEGASNRAFVIHFRNGFKLVARIPYPATEPTHLVVASEAATLIYLRSKGIPVPEVYGYSASADNPAETEYIFMEFSPGGNLGSSWSDMGEQDRLRFVTSLVDLEARMFNLRLPASGSLYFARDLPAGVETIAVDSDDDGRLESLCVGPSTSLELWHGKRSRLDVDRGPYAETEDVLNSGAIKEIRYLDSYGRPLLPFDRMRRETFHLEKQSPSAHRDSLQQYLQISKHLIPQSKNGLARPVLRHPDLRPSNIFVSEKYEITSLIDWQNCTLLPLFLHSGIPEDLDNSTDPASRSLEIPQLPEEIPDLTEEERSEQLEVFRRRQSHYFYMRETAKTNPMHFEALSRPFSIGTRKIYQLSGAPWQGDIIPLKSSLIFTKQQWHQIAASPDLPCPITFTEEEERECLRLDELEREAVVQLEASKEILGLGPEGWVSCDNYEAARETIARMKAMCLEQASTEMERTAVRDHWVYDDMDEDEYL